MKRYLCKALSVLQDMATVGEQSSEMDTATLVHRDIVLPDPLEVKARNMQLVCPAMYPYKCCPNNGSSEVIIRNCMLVFCVYYVCCVKSPVGI